MYSVHNHLYEYQNTLIKSHCHINRFLCFFMLAYESFKAYIYFNHNLAKRYVTNAKLHSLVC